MLKILKSSTSLLNKKRNFHTSYYRFNYWTHLQKAPVDKILGLTELYKNDKSDLKVNLGVGAYKTDNGDSFVLPSVREAETRIYNSKLNHEYCPIAGIKEYIDLSIEFAYGSDSHVIKNGQIASIQSLSGTGSLRLIAEFISKFYMYGPKNKLLIHLPDPTWGNHSKIMNAAGLEVNSYRYYDKNNNSLDFVGMLEDFHSAESGSVFLIHACAHNPTGCDPNNDQWNQLSKVAKSKKHLIIFDCAYQGFASGDAQKDAYAIRKFVKDGHQIILSQSFAKNFGLYGERIGTLSIVTNSKEEAINVNSQLLLLVRAMYSSPPIHGARLVAEILKDPILRSQWVLECKSMADRIHSMRVLLKSSLEKSGSKLNWDHVLSQIGMFCFSGLSEKQVKILQDKYHIYCTTDGRLSISGLNSKNVDYVAKAIHDVTK